MRFNFLYLYVVLCISAPASAREPPVLEYRLGDRIIKCSLTELGAVSSDLDRFRREARFRVLAFPESGQFFGEYFILKRSKPNLTSLGESDV